MVQYFISGHIDLSPDEFAARYHAPLEAALRPGPAPAHFVVGDAPGADLLAQQYLLSRGVDPAAITVFHMGSAPRCTASPQLPCVGGFGSHAAKDAAMTRASDADIAFPRSEAEQRACYGDRYRPRVSGTEKNLLRRQRLTGGVAPPASPLMVPERQAVSADAKEAAPKPHRPRRKGRLQ